MDVNIDWLTVKWDRTNDNAIMFDNLWRPSLTRKGQMFMYTVFGGEWFSMSDSANQDGKDIVRQALATKGKVTRVDFAIDLQLTVDYDALYVYMQSVLGKEYYVYRYTSQTGYTVYVGKRSSKRFLRIYNKRAEVNEKKGIDVGFDWCRIELEVKKEAIATYLLTFLNQSSDKIAQDIVTRYMLKGFFGDCLNDGDLLRVPRIRQKRDALLFCERYKRIIREAFLQNRRLFFKMLLRKGIDDDKMCKS
jgi:hypothetical protein